MERSSTTPVICSIRSASVDFPWSMWAMMQKLRSKAASVEPGGGAAEDGNEHSRLDRGGRTILSRRNGLSSDFPAAADSVGMTVSHWSERRDLATAPAPLRRWLAERL